MRKHIVRFMVFYILSIGCLLGIVIYSYQNKIDRHNEQVEIEYPGVWKLSDEYDNRNSSYMEFLHQKNSLSILKEVYKELEKAEQTLEQERENSTQNDDNLKETEESGKNKLVVSGNVTINTIEYLKFTATTNYTLEEKQKRYIKKNKR